MATNMKERKEQQANALRPAYVDMQRPRADKDTANTEKRTRSTRGKQEPDGYKHEGAEGATGDSREASLCGHAKAKRPLKNLEHHEHTEVGHVRLTGGGRGGSGMSEEIIQQRKSMFGQGLTGSGRDGLAAGRHLLHSPICSRPQLGKRRL
jgi:hypothetical protein